MGLGLHLAKLTLAFLVFLTIWEGTVHGTLDILFDQRGGLRGLIISNPLLRLTMADNYALGAVAAAIFLLEGGVRVLLVRQQTPREVRVIITFLVRVSKLVQSAFRQDVERAIFSLSLL